MTKETLFVDGNVFKKSLPEHNTNPGHDIPERQETPESDITLLQQRVGNRAVGRLIARRNLAQRSGSTANENQPYEVDDETAKRIEQERGDGQALDSAVQERMGAAMGFDFSQVKVHVSQGADALNRELEAEAFTTGNDIFFRQGAYDPHSSSGQELLAHEMAHVVQQSSGLVGGGSRLMVNAPNDAYERDADAAARAVVSQPASSPVPLQREEVQRQEVPEEEEEIQTRQVQRQELEEEEEVQTQRIQRQELEKEEDEQQARRIQKQDLEEEEEVQTRRA